jgi:demethylmenaquinone methyltransferase/2-methoxy-6-polyprenyl-1,4-benzoquinol methylase
MPEQQRQSKTTHFGNSEVPESAKAGLVAEVFHSVAERYDLMNDLMSFGMHRLWKRFAIAQSGVHTGQAVLDLASGTGDLARAFAERAGAAGRVIMVDINASMLDVGRRRLADRGIAGNIDFVQANAEALPFPDDHFDCISISFGLRNVTRMERALASMFRVLKPGGCLLVLEFSQPKQPLVARMYDAYSFTVLPLLGRYVANDERSYRYLAESIRKHPNQETLTAMIEEAGFERVRHFNLSAGVVALHKAYKL